MDHSQSSFLSGCAAFTYMLMCAKERDDNSDKGILLTNFFAFHKGNWQIFPSTVPWTAIAMATIKPDGAHRVLVGVSPQGDYWECVTNTVTESTGTLDSEPVLARNLTVVGDVVFAVGMARVVYRREGPGRWTSVGPNAPLPAEGVAGFNDMAAASATEMYAVGWEGEIWQYDGKQWTAIDSPTSAHLRAICYGSDGLFYAVGYNGVMVRGRADKWSLVETGRPENLMDVCSYAEKIYVCTDFEILELTKKGLMPTTDSFADPDDKPATCLHLLVAADGLFSMGTHDLFLNTAGVWRRVV